MHTFRKHTPFFSMFSHWKNNTRGLLPIETTVTIAKIQTLPRISSAALLFEAQSAKVGNLDIPRFLEKGLWLGFMEEVIGSYIGFWLYGGYMGIWLLVWLLFGFWLVVWVRFLRAYGYMVRFSGVLFWPTIKPIGMLVPCFTKVLCGYVVGQIFLKVWGWLVLGSLHFGLVTKQDQFGFTWGLVWLVQNFTTFFTIFVFVFFWGGKSSFFFRTRFEFQGSIYICIEINICIVYTIYVLYVGKLHLISCPRWNKCPKRNQPSGMQSCFLRKLATFS